MAITPQSSKFIIGMEFSPLNSFTNSGGLFKSLAPFLTSVQADISALASSPSGGVIASALLTGNTSNIGTTTIYTPSSDSDYTATIYIEGTVGGSGVLELDVNWTDDNGSQSEPFLLDLSQIDSGYFQKIIHAKSGTNITYSTTIQNAGAPPNNYNLFLNIIQG